MAYPLPPALARAADAVLPAIRQAAERTGVDFAALFHTARLESGFNPAARARTSSAAGLFQFIDSSWLNTLAKHGARHGITPGSRAEALALKTDAGTAALMAAEHMADNAATLEKALGRAASTVDLYLAHFLGAGGATRFLGAMAGNPAQAAASLFPAPANANRAIFYAQDGSARSLADIHALFARKLGLGDTSAPPPTGTTLPPAGTFVPPRLAASLAAAPATLATPASDADPRLMAQAARLLLAELGAG